MKVLGMTIGLPTRIEEERDALRHDRKVAAQRADEARKKFLDALAKAVIDDLNGRPAGG